MKRVDDYRLRFGKKELVPIVTGGMGVDISTAALALEAARLGGVGHISDAMVQTVSDRRFQTHFVKEKTKLYKYNVANSDKSSVLFDLGRLAEATHNHVGRTMAAKRGDGLIFVNCMEKLTMNAPRETLRVRMSAALDAGIDGITLSAGLHLGSFALIADHPRFRDAKLGIIVSSLRALQIFLRKNARLARLPDYVVVEGPLAGGHLGFGIDDWMKHDLRAIVADDVTFVDLKASWDKGLREANTLGPDARATAIAALVKQLETEMRSAQLEPAQIEKALPVWKTVGDASARLNATGAGQMMLGFERDAKSKDVRVGELIRSVANTADWALISKSEQKLLKGSDFARAWQELEKIESPKTASKPVAMD